MEDLCTKININKEYSDLNKTNEEDRSFENEDSITEVETKKSYLLNPIHSHFPATIFFQYDSEICKQKNTSKRRNEIIWKDSLLNQIPNKKEYFELGKILFFLINENKEKNFLLLKTIIS